MIAHNPADFPNFYDLLGLPANTTPVEIDAAFCRMVRRHSSALFSSNQCVRLNAELLLSEVLKAYRVLGNSARRYEYDRQRLERLGNWEAQMLRRLSELSDVLSDAPQEHGASGTSFFGSDWFDSLQEWFSAAETSGQRRRVMAALSSALLLPLPFFLARVV